MISRRHLLLALPAASLARPARGQQPPRQRIGWVSTETQPDPFIDGFREGLRKLGYVEGQNVEILVRYAPGDAAALRQPIRELIEANVAFIVSSGPAIRAIAATRDIPVLFAISGDPVELGLAQSLARPGGNFTGSTFLSLEIAGKRVELLREALPQLQSLGVLAETNHPGEKSELRETEKAAKALGLELKYMPFRGAAELDGALARLGDARPQAILVFPDGVTIANRVKIAQFAIARGLPSMFGWSEFVDAGGLMSYGANQRETYFDLASYAVRMLRGEKPGELPIKQPTVFELVLNLSTARLLRASIAQSIVLRATRTIE